MIASPLVLHCVPKFKLFSVQSIVYYLLTYNMTDTLYYTSTKPCNLIGPLQVVYFTYAPVIKSESFAHITTLHLWFFMMSSKCRQPLDAEQLPCNNAGVVTRCLLTLCCATCGLLAVHKSMLVYNRKVVVTEWSRALPVIQMTQCWKIIAGN